jgi:DNA modification methylase
VERIRKRQAVTARIYELDDRRIRAIVEKDHGVFGVMSVELILGDILNAIKQIDSESVQCVVTSPPYYGLRDYGTAKWEGGDLKCKHNPQKPDGGDRFDRSLPLGRGGIYKETCKCGAIRIDSQIGLEQTPEEYITKLVEVFREVRRVLRSDGTLWLNLGDSYAGSSMNGGPQETRCSGGKKALRQIQKENSKIKVGVTVGYKPKDLIGIPWRVAFALRADGWWLRQDIIWAKPNPMPESVKDRCTKSHEYIFLLSKSARYYFDADAIMEPVTGGTHARVSQNVAKQIGSYRANGGKKTNGTMKAVIRTPKQQPAGSGIKNNDSFNNALALPVETRNSRSVWTITTIGYPGAHFATFPPDIPTRCIKAGSKPGDIVLDPFCGSGTTGFVATELGRNFIGIDLNPKYVKMAQNRINGAKIPLGIDL